MSVSIAQLIVDYNIVNDEKEPTANLVKLIKAMQARIEELTAYNKIHGDDKKALQARCDKQQDYINEKLGMIETNTDTLVDYDRFVNIMSHNLDSGIELLTNLLSGFGAIETMINKQSPELRAYRIMTASLTDTPFEEPHGDMHSHAFHRDKIETWKRNVRRLLSDRPKRQTKPQQATDGEAGDSVLSKTHGDPVEVHIHRDAEAQVAHDAKLHADAESILDAQLQHPIIELGRIIAKSLEGDYVVQNAVIRPTVYGGTDDSYDVIMQVKRVKL